jgi:glycine/D-amino acid oxidase-like deaminating enzyme
MSLQKSFHRPESAQWSYWERELGWDRSLASYLARRPMDSDYDFVVVGAGFTGLSAAYHLATKHKGAKIALLDRYLPPLGASTRNAGFACIGTVGEFIADSQLEQDERVWDRMSERWQGLSLLRSILGDQVIGYEPLGGHELFTEEEEFERVSTYLASCNTALKQRTGLDHWYKLTSINGYNAIQMPREGQLQPAMAWSGFAQLCEQMGIHLVWGRSLVEMTEKMDGVILRVEESENGNRELHSSSVILATNAFSKSLDPDVSVRPGRGLVLLTKALVSQPWRGTFHAQQGYIYFRNVGADRLLLGGARHVDLSGETTAQFGVNSDIKAFLGRYMKEVLRIDPTEVEFEWSGIMGFTPDKNPVIRTEISGNTAWAVGLSGMGVALSTELGRKAAEFFS